MSKKSKLKASLKSKQAAYLAIEQKLDGMGDPGDFSSEQATEFDDLVKQGEELKPEIDQLHQSIANLEDDSTDDDDDQTTNTEGDDDEPKEEDDDDSDDGGASNRRQRLTALKGRQSFGGMSSPLRISQKAPSKAQLKNALGLAMQALCLTQGNIFETKRIINKSSNDLARQFLNTGTESSGGFVIPPAYSPQLIDLLFEDTHIRKLAKTVELMGNEWRQPKKASSARPDAASEGSNLAYDELALDELKMTGRKRGVVTAFTDELMRRSSPAAQQLIVDDLKMNITDDEEGILTRGTEDANRTFGLTGLVAAANKFVPTQAGPVPTIQEVRRNLRKMITVVRKRNVKLRKAYWVMGVEMLAWLEQLEGVNNDFAFPSIQQNRTLFGYPILDTTNVPENTGVGGDETEIMFTDFSHILYGHGDELGIHYSRDALINTGSGDLNLFQADMTAVKISYYHALNTEHDFALSMMEQVKWHTAA